MSVVLIPKRSKATAFFTLKQPPACNSLEAELKTNGGTEQKKKSGEDN